MTFLKFSLAVSSAVFALTLSLIRIVGSGQPLARCPFESSLQNPGPQPAPSSVGISVAAAGARVSLATVQDAQTNDAERTYVVRVVAADSKTSIVNATVQVDIPGATKKQGSTDSAGIFWFTWRSAKQSIRVHSTVQAPGFVSLDEFRNLRLDTLIQLAKAKQS